MRKRISMWAIAEIGCYLLTGAGLFYLVLSNHYLDFVTPKMKSYLLFSGFVFLIWGIVDIPASRKAKYKRSIGPYVLLMAPMLLLTAGINIGEFHEVVNGFHSTNEAIEVFADSPKGESAILIGLDQEKREIHITKKQYLKWMAVLLKNGEQYEDYTIFIEGMICQEGEMDQRHEFLLIRKFMSCCAADVMPVGMECHWEGNLEEIDSEWVSVCAKVRIKEDGSCYLEVKSIIEEERPEEEYLYER
ncbi:MAG: TIGR03943 family protein [Lachnospiraceae bacterium]|nr:TIGR03943 family protein [Lachnospiraceae bacterium]